MIAPQNAALDDRASRLLDRFARGLPHSERRMLALRKQQALEEMEAVLDGYSRQLAAPRGDLRRIEAYRELLRVLRRPGGDAYTSLAFGRRCEEAGVRSPMGGVGDCFDHAMAEGLFATRECELLDRLTLRTRAEAERAIFAFIDGWYNPLNGTRLGHLSPINVEKQYIQHKGGAQTPKVELSTEAG